MYVYLSLTLLPLIKQKVVFTYLEIFTRKHSSLLGDHMNFKNCFLLLFSF